MNLDEAVARNKYTMHMSAVDISWRLGDICRSKSANLAVTPHRIIATIATIQRIPVTQLLERNRIWAISHPRMIAMLIIKKQCPNLSVAKIGRHFSMDHTSARHGILKARQLIQNDEDMHNLYVRTMEALDL